MPNEVLLKIFSYLSPRDWDKTTQKISKKMNLLSNSNVLWQEALNKTKKNKTKNYNPNGRKNKTTYITLVKMRKFNYMPFDKKGVKYLLKTDLKGIHLSRKSFVCFIKNGRTDFTGVNLSGVDLSNLKLKNMNFNEANFSKTDLSNSNCTYSKFNKTNFTKSILHKTIFLYASFDEAILYKVDAKGAYFRRAYGTNMDCRYGNFTDAHLMNASFVKSKFNYAILDKAFCYKATFNDSDFTNASCKKADFSHGNCINTKFFNANLKECDFFRVTFKSITEDNCYSPPNSVAKFMQNN
jgi:uncharacterized protein YjbI with pentapeptide repeats